MENFTKVVRIGLTARDGSLFCKIEWTSGRLSITGVEGPKRNGDCLGSCGQVIMNEWAFTALAPGWNAGRVARLREVWERWHLNDMVAGSPDQEAYLRAHPVEYVYPESHYTKASAALEAVGLNPDPDYLHNGKPYRYGHAWLREEVPADVLEFLSGLPDTDTEPAWV